MGFVIAAMVSILAAAVAFVCLDYETVKKVRFFDASDPDEVYTSKKFSRFSVVALVVALLVVVFLSAYKILDRVNTANGAAKMLLALICMTGAACFDYREHRIPNIFPLVMAAGAVILLLLGVALKLQGAVDYITTSVVAAVGCAVVLVVANFLTKQGIGAGDIKLISALALLTGVYAVVGTLFFGVVACAMYTVAALITKRKQMNSSVPFGPFLFFGYIITLFAIGF